MTPAPDGAASADRLPNSGTAPSDQALAEQGFDLGPAAAAPGRILLIACGALAREILAVTRQSGLEHLDLICLPAKLHNTPEHIPDAVRAAVTRHRASYPKIKLLYADCGTGGRLAALCDALGIEMLPGAHCYALFDGVGRFAARGEMTSFYLTDFLVRQFDAFVWRPLGLDRHPELRDLYFGNYRSLVHLAQVEDAATADLAAEHAARLGLAFERRLTGYGDLGASLETWARPGGERGSAPRDI
ncbi:DUF1638 domain-containing protein [Salipiger pacificus]|nr:DUF1638 domain-containing protein [Alloyangia pacifica]MCA0944373.1 DUF1638 domain-containing protein [Alloyangia pacifica]